MQINFHKISNDRHGLEILRDGGGREYIECETRSFLMHDLLHFAVESVGALRKGFWGQLAAGRRVSEMKEMASEEFQDQASELAAIERVVGAMHGLTKGLSAVTVYNTLMTMQTTSETALPPWVTEEFVAAVQERLRQLSGRWKATPFDGVMGLAWG